jgi:hypothetical protein
MKPCSQVGRVILNAPGLGTSREAFRVPRRVKGNAPHLICVLVVLASAFSLRAADSPSPLAMLKPEAFAHHIAFFNAMENEPVVNVVPNAESWAWLQTRVPFFECADRDVEEIYWFRWWALRKQLRKDPSGYFVFTEFITRPKPISSALGHHLMEGRWLRDQTFHDDDVLYWLRGNHGAPQEHLHRFSQWLADALWQRWLVTQDTPKLTALLDDLVRDFAQWEKDQSAPPTAGGAGPPNLYWQYDVRDAMEESISGSRTKKNIRPPLNSYMFGNATAIAAVARLAGREDLARQFDAKAAAIRRAATAALWDADAKFFKVRLEETGKLSDAREEIGFIPWYFHLPEAGHGYEAAWTQLSDDRGFHAPFGITTAERRHPQFRSHGTGTCEWDGAVWPFATSQTLTALANVLDDYPPQNFVTARDWFDAFITYTRSQRYDSLPYIGEYLDETTGQWLKGRNERSRWYNHSTYADLLITGAVGLRPRADDTIELRPLANAEAWPWFCLDGVKYHGRFLTIFFDRDGSHYHRGAGFTVLADGKQIAHAAKLAPLEGKLP